MATIRFYVGGHGDGARSGSQWLTPDLDYAIGYARKAGGYVLYVDIDENDPELVTQRSESQYAIGQVRYSSFAASAEIASRLKPYTDTAETAKLYADAKATNAAGESATAVKNALGSSTLADELLSGSIGFAAPPPGYEIDDGSPQTPEPSTTPAAGPSTPAGTSTPAASGSTSRGSGPATAGESPVATLERIREAVDAIREGMASGKSAGGNREVGSTRGGDDREDNTSVTGHVAEDIAFSQPPATRLGRLAHGARNAFLKGRQRLRAFRKASGGATGGRAAAAAGRAGVPAMAGGEAAVAGRIAASGGAAAAGGATGAAAIAGPIGLGVAAVAVLSTAAIKFGEAVYDFAKSRENEMRKLANVGAEQSAALAQLDADRTMRDIKTAEETGASGSDLAESMSNFEDALQPIESLLTNLQNTVGARLMDIGTGMLEAIKPAVETVELIYDCLPWAKGKKPDEKPETGWDIMGQIARQQEASGRPQWPGAAGRGPRGGAAGYGGKI